MNYLIRFFAKQHLFVNMITFFVIGIGIYSTITIKREAFPNISFDFVTVTTPYPNASAESVEQLITTPLESKLLEVEGVKEMSSVSIEGRSVIVLQLDPDQISVDEAEPDIQNVIDAFNQLPEDALDPVVISQDTSKRPLIELATGGDLSFEEIRTITKKLKRFVERINGVATVTYQGLPEYEIRVEAIPSKLAAYKMPLTELIGALRKASINVPAGSAAIEGEHKEFVIKTYAELENEKDVENTVVRVNSFGEEVRVKDVAKVTMKFAKQDILYRTNGKRGINLTVLKKSSEDTIRLVDRLKKEVDGFLKSTNPGYKVEYIKDQTVMVRNRVDVLTSNMQISLVLVLIVLWILLPFRIAVVAALGIPFSFFATLFIFDAANISLNLISMMGLIIVLGMLVDDAIVVTENAQRHMDLGLSNHEAAVKGTTEVWAPVLVSSLTTLAAFLPLMFMDGIMGKFVSNIPIGVILALIISIIECFFILPSHISSWVKAPKPNKKPWKYGFTSLWDRFFLPAYAAVVRSAAKVRYLVIILVTCYVGYSIYFAKTKMGFELFPGREEDNFVVNFETTVGTPIEQTEVVAGKIEQALMLALGNDLDSITTNVGSQSTGGHGGGVTTRGSQYGQITVNAKTRDDRSRSMVEINKASKVETDKITDAQSITYSAGRSGPPVGQDVSIDIIGEDYKTIESAIDDVKELVKSVPGTKEVTDSIVLGKDQLIVTLDEVKLELAGMSKVDVATSVRASYDGVVVETIKKLDEEIDVLVSLPEQTSNSINDLKNLKVPNRKGSLVSLSSVATISKESSLGAIQHIEGLRRLQVTAEVDKTTNSAQVNKILQEKIKTIEQKYPNLEFAFGGAETDRRESLVGLVKSFGIAFIGIILLIFFQFKNFYQPFVIALTIPMSLLSVVWVFYFSDQPISFLGLVGMVALAGVVVNNAIVFIDFTNRLRLEGIGKRESIFQAANSRLRPIFLTTVTTAVGILPTAYGIGGRDDFVIPIALALGWGVLLGSILTTLILPILLLVSEDIVSLYKKIKNFIYKQLSKIFSPLMKIFNKNPQTDAGNLK